MDKPCSNKYNFIKNQIDIDGEKMQILKAEPQQ